MFGCSREKCGESRGMGCFGDLASMMTFGRSCLVPNCVRR